MITRIHKFIDKEGISVRRFEQSINASNGLIRKAIANKTDVQSKWILEIADIYPNLNLDWLIKGEGNMYRDDDNSNNEAQKAVITIYKLHELQAKLDSLEKLIQTKRALIESQLETIKAKNDIIEVKDKIIASLLEKKLELKS